MYTNFKFATQHGRRVAIFAEPHVDAKGKQWTKVTVITCSLSDAFSKRRAKEIFNNFKSGEAFYEKRQPGKDGQIVKAIAHPEVFLFPFKYTDTAVDRFVKATYLKFIPLSVTDLARKEILVGINEALEQIAKQNGHYLEKRV